jgi:hypothetical protein
MITPTTGLSTREASLREIQELADVGHLYAFVDACDVPAVPAKIQEAGAQRGVSLYRGTADEEYWAVAPYVVCVDRDMLRWIWQTLWQEPWGIFVVADVGLEALRRHFRTFLQVLGPDGDEMYFRYYDPRVLRTFLPTCSSSELREFFGPVQAYAITDTPPTGVWLYRALP